MQTEPTSSVQMAAPGRIIYLDNLRVFAMLFGILVHTSTIDDYAFSRGIQEVSDNFRMGTFYAVSGLLSGIVLTKIGYNEFVRRRAKSLLIPFFSALVLLNSLSVWLVFKVHNPNLEGYDYWDVIAASTTKENGFNGPVIWSQHLWFLTALFAHACFSGPLIWIFSAIQRLRLSKLFGLLPGRLVLSCLAVTVAVLVVAGRAFFLATFGRVGLSSWIIQSVFAYAPFYALGLYMHLEPSVRNKAESFDTFSFIVLIVGIAIRFLIPDGGIGWQIVDIVTQNIIVSCSCFLLFHVFATWMAKQNSIMRKLSRAIYSMYLLHYVVIYIIAFICMNTMGIRGVGVYIVVAVVTPVTTFLIHEKVIAKSKALSFMLNGRRV